MMIPSTDHLIVGMSPFNPRFSASWLAALFRWGAESFTTVDVLHPGEIAASLLIATGTPEGRARRKARQQCNKDVRTVHAAEALSGVSLSRGAPVLISDLIENPDYQHRRTAALREYENNPSFQSACLSMSEAACRSRQRVRGAHDAVNLSRAVSYVIDEIPAYTHCAEFFGYPSAALCYPKNWLVGDMMRSGRTSLEIDPHSSFLVFNPEREDNHV
ncbi:tRNA-dependent cyclodipeptide synthase [Corynebacterium uropygiale]|uniref:Cyclodipeptide synthase n=1 Tax=Corynebacterium uropygiale TaxID=1775911 RepID=A0A9X1QSV3_9CORY|nr:tRNA-dependent cyclodipeptide synthase [Corynebacterium uropygiale]MCF4007600.1 tRNA-dependent cyclodipeptide synthase [Corynebacterium uropygiale]